MNLSRPADWANFGDDATLARHCLRNDPHAIRALVEQYTDVVFGLCIRLLGHRHDAEDVTQEVFVRVFRSLRRWDAARPLKPWLLAITVLTLALQASEAATRRLAVACDELKSALEAHAHVAVSIGIRGP